jgi:hypothetical protein
VGARATGCGRQDDTAVEEDIVSHQWGPLAALAGDEFHWKDAIISIVVLTLGSWLIFIYGLKLVIPLWPTFIGN